MFPGIEPKVKRSFEKYILNWNTVPDGNRITANSGILEVALRKLGGKYMKTLREFYFSQSMSRTEDTSMYAFLFALEEIL